MECFYFQLSQDIFYSLLIFLYLLVVQEHILVFLLNDNFFTEFYCFLSNLNMNQPYPFHFEPTSYFPPHPTPLGETEPLFEFPEPDSKFPLAIYFTYDDVSFHVTLPMLLTLSSSLPMSISLFPMSVCPLLLYK